MNLKTPQAAEYLGITTASLHNFLSKKAKSPKASLVKTLPFTLESNTKVYKISDLEIIKKKFKELDDKPKPINTTAYERRYISHALKKWRQQTGQKGFPAQTGDIELIKLYSRLLTESEHLFKGKVENE